MSYICTSKEGKAQEMQSLAREWSSRLSSSAFHLERELGVVNRRRKSNPPARSAPMAAACTERRPASAGCEELAAPKVVRGFCRAEKILIGVFLLDAALENEDGVLRAER